MINVFSQATPEEEKNRDKARSVAYANALSEQIESNRQLTARNEEKLKTRYYLGDTNTPPPTGNVYQEMKESADLQKKTKQLNYADALDDQVQALKTFRAAAVSKCRVVVASMARQKLTAVSDAVTNGEIVGIEAESGVSPQPTGLDEITAGARNRMTCILNHDASKSADFAVAIENGIVNCGSAFIDLAIVIVRDIHSGAESMSSSGGVQIPAEYIDVWNKSNKFDTVGAAIAAENNCDKQDPQRFLTNKKHQRQSLLQHAVSIAFSTLA
jgi:non-canonical (house-cleaning) NTP pyrophosphatase